MPNNNLTSAETQGREAIFAADRRRYQAMHEADVATLENILHERFYYTHSSGRTDTKSAYIDNISSGYVRYGKGLNSDIDIIFYGTTALMHGRMALDCFTADGQYFPLNNRFTSVWVKFDKDWKLVAWVSTPLATNH